MIAFPLLYHEHLFFSELFGVAFSSKSRYIETTNRIVPLLSADYWKLYSDDQRVPNLRQPEVNHPIATKSFRYLFYIAIGIYGIAAIILVVERCWKRIKEK